MSVCFLNIDELVQAFIVIAGHQLNQLSKLYSVYFYDCFLYVFQYFIVVETTSSIATNLTQGSSSDGHANTTIGNGLY